MSDTGEKTRKDGEIDLNLIMLPTARAIDCGQ